MTYQDNIYLLHGYTASPKDNWFPWLRSMMQGKLGQKLQILNLPNSDSPSLVAWNKTCDTEINPQKNLTIIGHSLGCIQALHYIDQHDVQDVNVICVSGFDETTHTLPQLKQFTAEPIDYKNVQSKIKQAVVISAIDDTIVPSFYSETLARHLGCKFVLMPNGGHFIDQENVLTLPVVYQELRQMLAR